MLNKMLYHLYKHTLYEKLGNLNIINILFSGFDIYGQKFLDACLQVGQIPNKTLNINVICSEKEEEQYINDRPELKNFFNIDDKESYGTIKFIHNTNEINLVPCYIFAENLETAKKFREIYPNCSINFVQLSNNFDEQQNFGDLNPIYVEENFNDPELKRMALNVHLIWEKGWGQSFNKVLEDFGKSYNHDSCISNVISLKYKLFSLGFNLDQIMNMEINTQLKEIKKITETIIKDKKQLIYCEHKRWVVEKICDGWKKKDIKTCDSKKTAKNDDEKTHICIVKSSTKHTITSFLTDSIEAWDNPDPAKLNQLDELDKMSVKFHQHLLNKVVDIDKENVISISSEIKVTLENHSEIAVAFEELYSCMNDILTASHVKSAQTIRDKVYVYEKTLLKNFENKLALMVDGKDKERTKVYTNRLKVAFSSILESRRYIDYKQEDVALIDNIPFILTYITDINLVVPFFSNIHDSTKFFNNIASALVINPKRIIYICKSCDMSENAFRKLFQFAKKKELRAEIELKIIGNEKKFNLSDIGVNIQYFDSINAIREYITNVNEGKTVIDRNGATIFRENMDGGFDFKSHSMTFENTRGFSSALKYINKKPFINTTDVIFFDLTGKIEIDSPKFFRDYQQLWELYKEKHYAWKMLTNALSNYVDRENIILSIPIYDNRNNRTKREYRISPDWRKTAEKIIATLCSAGIITNNSNVDSSDVYSCLVTIYDIGDHSEYFTKIFEDEKLKSADDFNIYKPQDQSNVKIKYNDMKITDCKLLQNLDHPEIINDIPQLINDMRAILINLQDMNHIRSCSVDEQGNINLTFATPQIKDLLTKAGKILEIYVYHKAKGCVEFTDVTSSLTLEHGENQAKNEIDCVITKGFNTLLIECKACYELKEEWYKKFGELTEHFGINAKKLFIADLGGHEDSTTNKNCIEYGRTTWNIDTIYQPDKIENIVNTLKERINNV